MTRNINIGTSSVFVFLAILLTVSRLPLPAIIHPGFDVALSAIVVFVAYYICFGNQALRTSLVSISSFIVLLLLWAFATSALFSPGDDEYAYHLTAIWDIATGWHPFFSSHKNIWIDSYPSGNWAIESYLVSTTGLLLSGQSLVVGLMAVVALQAYNMFLERFSAQQLKFRQIGALLFAALVAGNPIVLTQVMTHYTDAPLYLIGCGLICFLISDTFSANRMARFGAFACIILLINTKTATLYYVPLIVFAAMVMELILQREKPDFFRRTFNWILSKGALYGLVAIFATVVIGYKPYVTNILDHHSVLYPSVDEIMSYNVPTNLIGQLTPVKFFYGVFSETGGTEWPIVFDAPIQLKIPGTFDLGEFKVLRFDTRRGGFGPFFSLAFLSALLAFVACKWASRDRGKYSWRTEGDGIASFALVLLIISVFFPESWWARYVPFTWLSIVLFTLSTLFISGDGIALIAIRVLRGLAFVSFLLCILAAAAGTARQTWHVYKKTQAIEALREMPLIEFHVDEDDRITTDHQSTIVSDADVVWVKLLKKRGINAQVVSSSDRYNPTRSCDNFGFLEAHVFWCVPKTK